MNILLILAIFWPALAGLVIFLTPGCKENKQLRGRAVNAALAVELAPHRITCNALAPGAIDTTRGAAAGAAPANRVNRPIPLKRFGTVEEIAAMVRLLVGPEGTFITGQTIHVNGGEFLT